MSGSRLTRRAARPENPPAMEAEPGRIVLAGVGVDAEEVRRFKKLAAGSQPWRLVFSPGEAERLAAQPQPDLALCAAFCCKEAFCKALGERYPFVELECRFADGADALEAVPSAALCERHGIAGVRVRLRGHYAADRGECVAEVCLFRTVVPPGGGAAWSPATASATDGLPEVRTRLRSLAVADAVRGRAQIEARQFSATELVELNSRQVQSLAGSLALKSALVALWGDAGVSPPPSPRDFVLSHAPGGAPCIVQAPPGPQGPFVSIAHTRTWAYGLAALAI